MGNLASKSRIDVEAVEADTGANTSEILVICFKQPGENDMLVWATVKQGVPGGQK